MSDIKITGLWDWLNPIMSDPTDPMNPSVTKLGLLTRIILKGQNFEAIIFSGGRDAFLEEYTIQNALSLSSAGVSFENYPCWITATSADLEVPKGWPSSVNVDEDGSETPKTFRQWCEGQNHDCYEDISGAFAGNFAKYGWEFTKNVPVEEGFDLMDESVAKARIAAIQPEE